MRELPGQLAEDVVDHQVPPLPLDGRLDQPVELLIGDCQKSQATLSLRVGSEPYLLPYAA